MKLIFTLMLLSFGGISAFAQDFSNAFPISPAASDARGEIIGIENNGTDVFVAGNWTGYYDMDPRGTSSSVTSNDQDIFLARYDDNGELVWGVTIGGTNIDEVTDLTLLESTSPDGGVYISGNFESGTITFPNAPNVNVSPSPLTTSKSTVGGSDVFIAKYDLSGNLQWVYSFGSSDNDYCTTVDVNLYDDNGTDKIKLAIGGYVYGSNGMDVDPSGINTWNVASAGGMDAWLAVYEDNGSSITFEGASYYGDSGADEDIVSVALNYPEIYSASNFQDDAAYNVNIQHSTSVKLSFM